MKLDLTEVDEKGYPYWVDLPLQFWNDKELKEWLWEIGVI